MTMFLFAIIFTLAEIWNIMNLDSKPVWISIVSEEMDLLGKDLNDVKYSHSWSFNLLTLFTTLTNCMTYFIIAIVAMQTA
jgi:hypothetical protein